MLVLKHNVAAVSRLTAFIIRYSFLFVNAKRRKRETRSPFLRSYRNSLQRTSYAWKIKDLPPERWRSMENQRFTTLHHRQRDGVLLLLPVKGSVLHRCKRVEAAQVGRQRSIWEFIPSSSPRCGENLRDKANRANRTMPYLHTMRATSRWFNAVPRIYPIELASMRRNFKRQGVRARARRSRIFIRQAEQVDRQRSILEFIPSRGEESCSNCHSTSCA